MDGFDSKLLITVGAVLTAIAAILHIFIILGGPSWYRFFGAGEGMATLAESGSVRPVYITSMIFMILSVWAIYGFSAAGYLITLPFLKPVLWLISLIFLIRGLAAIPAIFYFKHPYLMELKDKMLFMICSSLICVFLGVVYLIAALKASANTL
jgi:putative oxidoreductase